MKAEVKVIELADKYYQIEGTDCIFPKEKALSVTVEIEHKGYCIKRTLSSRENADLNIWANKKNGNTIPYYKGSGGYLHYSSGSAFILPIKLNGFAELNTVKDFFEKTGYIPEPQRKSLGMYDGVEIYEETDAWFVDLKELKIVKFDYMKHSLAVAGSEGDKYDYSKMYLTPKEANARLKGIVTDKAIDYPFTITTRKYNTEHKIFIDYAIEAFEKDHNITYLPE